MLHTISSQFRGRKARRVGRGGKRGTTAGRGTKGQSSRAGAKIRPAEQDFIIRLPKRRGFKNRSLKPKPQVVTLGQLEATFKTGDRVTTKSIIEQGLIRVSKGDRFTKVIKVLGSGRLTKKLTVQGLDVSGSAAKRIVAAGGKVVK